MPTKVKIFQHALSVSRGSTGSGPRPFQKLEDDINAFLQANPRAKPVDVKLSSHAAPVENGPTNYGVVALLIYEES